MKRDNWIAFVPFYLLTLLIFIALAQGGSEAVTTVSERLPVERVHCVVIDAGHGGEDGGATSCTGVLESGINLEIALRLEDLMSLLGYDTLSIRKTDTSVYTQGTTIAQKKVSDLKERVRIVNETPGAVLVSIHQNTFPVSRYGGAQVFYAPTADSQRLAEATQTALNAALDPDSRRRVKKGQGIYLLEHIQPCGILVECGFLSNPEEEARLRDPAYQKKLCCILGSALSQFLVDRAEKS